MKAIVYTQYGTPDVLKLEEIPQPTSKDYQVMVKIHAASVNAADWHLLTADIFLVRLMMGLFKPKKQHPRPEYVCPFKYNHRPGLCSRGDGCQFVFRWLLLHASRVVVGLPKSVLASPGSLSSWNFS